jgi:hypothetical protein
MLKISAKRRRKMTEHFEFDGDTVTINSLSIENSSLVEYLGLFEEDSYEQAFNELLQIALDVRSAFTTDLETKNINDTAQSVIDKMNETYLQIVDDLEEKLLEMMDPENGPILKSFEKITGENLKDMLSPERDPDVSPIARLRTLVAADLKGHQDSVTESLNAIKTKLRIEKSVRKNAQDGNDFEAKVDKIIQDFARIYADTAEPTGTIKESGGSKKGDTKVTLNKDDTMGKVCTLVWEAKTDMTFKSDRTNRVIDDQVKKELNSAISDRGSDAAILVLDSDLLNLDDQPSWREYDGNKLLIIVDTFNPEPEMIRLAYLWGRWKSRSSIGNLEAKIDIEGIRGSFDEMNLRLKDLRNVKKHHNEAIGSINSAGELLKLFRSDIKNMIEELALMVNINIEADLIEPDLEDEQKR